MNNKRKTELQIEIDKLNNNKQWWYQPIKFCNELMTHSPKKSDHQFYNNTTFGKQKWDKYIQPFLPFDLKNKVVLDIGCNAGYFLIQSIKSGASFAYGIEPDKSCGSHFDNGFDKQLQLVIDIYSELDNYDYSKQIKVINKQFHEIEWEHDFKHNIDITYAFNVLYWLIFSDEKGTIPNGKLLLQQMIDKINKYSEYLFIIGDEAVQAQRKSKNKNTLGTGIQSTLPMLINYQIIKQWVDPKPIHRKPSIIIAKSHE